MTERHAIAPGVPAGASALTRGTWRWPAVVVIAVLTIGVLVDRAVGERSRQVARDAVQEKLFVLRGRLESRLTSSLFLVRGLALEIALHPDADATHFDALGRMLVAEGTDLRSISAAPDLIIRHVYPLAENRAAIGLDYRAVPAQRDAALRARDTGQVVVAGPVELVQGGRGLIVRAPVFTDDDGGARRFWGLVAAVVDLDQIYARVGLHDPGLSLKVAIRGRDGLGATGEVFYGSPSLFDQDSVVAEVQMPGGSWQLAATPRDGWPTTSPEAWVLRLVTVLIACLAAGLAAVRVRAERERAGARAELGRSSQRLADAIDAIHEGFVLWDADDRFVLCNARYREIYGPLADGLRPGVPYRELLQRFVADGNLHISEDPETWITARASGHREARGNVELRFANGRVIGIAERRTADGGLVGIHTDVTEIRRAEEDVHRRANFDPLTGLANRASFLEQLDAAVRRAQRSRTAVALLFIDLDRFKNVNDAFGHEIGDALLVEAARRIRACIRETDLVARLGGDEFTVLLTDSGPGMASTVVAEAIIDAIARPFVLDHHEVFAGASIGITAYPADGRDAGELLRNADIAMYAAKARGRGVVCYFTREMTQRAERFVALERHLRHAIDAGEFEIWLQPIVRLADDAVIGAEALARWCPPGREPVLPGEFIPVAEESGLIEPLGRWLLEAACREAARWPVVAGEPLYLAVNVSSRQFRAGFGPGQVESALAASGVGATRLVLEITESLLMEEDDRVREALEGLRALGVRIAVDDFGTGYSSLSYLRRFPVSALKIDREFVRDMEHDPADARLVETIVAMARGLAIEAVAEGVETPGQARLLHALGCPYAQGFHYARPMPADEFAARIAALPESGQRPAAAG
ncbi:MAG: EAL domain-containing protein [Planctomycetes bacterium]|nr:EAL domain-containing protein [Planctomycetota bacterium]